MFYPGEVVLYKGETYYVLGSPRIGAGGFRYTIATDGALIHGICEGDLDFPPMTAPVTVASAS